MPKFCEARVHDAIRSDPRSAGRDWRPNGIQVIDGRPAWQYRHCLICNTDVCSTVGIERAEVAHAA